MRGILSLCKYDFWHAAPDPPAQVDTGKIPDMFEAEPFDHPGCLIQGALPVLVAGENFLHGLVWLHGFDNTDMERRIIS
jgi:hypothetical protein